MAEHSVIGPVDLLVLQPTPFCNIDCRYCYLANRADSSKMSIDTFQKIMAEVEGSGYLAPNCLVLWHAGEPLVAPLEFYRAASNHIQTLNDRGLSLVQSIQTNATLISEKWCDLFADEKIRISVSLDGPAFIHDRNRVSRHGSGTHAASMRGVELLQKAGLEYNAICVLTDFSLDYPDEIYGFFEEAGVGYVGFNVEESEGCNISETFRTGNGLVQRFKRFLEKIYELQEKGSVRVREFLNVESNATKTVEAVDTDRLQKTTSLNRPLSILTVDCNGNAATFSPELLGTETPRYGKFFMANLVSGSFADILKSGLLSKAARDIEEGKRLCRQECEYYCLCGGGAPSNKLSENGTFATSTTQYCQTQIIPAIDVALSGIESKLAREGKYELARVAAL